jgi:hypothetical protein
MPYLVDTNVMWRRFDPADARQPAIKAALDKLLLAGETVYITAQNWFSTQPRTMKYARHAGRCAHGSQRIPKSVSGCATVLNNWRRWRRSPKLNWQRTAVNVTFDTVALEEAKWVPKGRMSPFLVIANC